MSYEMSSLRKEDLSLYLYVKDIVLKNFREIEEYISLRLMSDISNPDSYVYECSYDSIPSPSDNGRGWVYFDTSINSSSCEPYTLVSGLNGDGFPAIGTPEQYDSVVLYETTASGLSPVDWKEYMIDYVDCRIITQRPLSDPKVSFIWNYVSVVDEWASVEAANSPVVVIDLGGTDKKGYQLGGGKKSVRKVDIHVFATSAAERNDIIETIYDGLYNKSCTLFDFPSGTILDYDGTFYGRRNLLDRIPNPINKLTFLFDRKKISNISRLQFESVTSRNVNLPLLLTRDTMLSDLNAYRSKISFDMLSYDDRIIGDYS